MKLKKLLFACAIAFIPISYQGYIFTKPPFLKHSNYSCWNDAAIWLLYNIPELVDGLIEKKASYKENSDLRNLVNLLEAMKKRELADEKKDDIKQLENNIADAQKKFHKESACSLVKTIYGNFNDASELFGTIVRQIPFSQNIISYYYKPKFAKSSEHTLLSKKYKKNEHTGSPEKYLYLNSVFNAFDANKKIKSIVTFFEVDDENKPTGKTYDYEFIGMIVGGAGHATAYIKDQREKDNPWYYCNDLNDVIKKANTKELPLPLDWSNINFKENTHPLVLLYKKLPDSNSIDTFAQALQVV